MTVSYTHLDVYKRQTVDGVYGTNNFYLTTNGNFGMSQIGHKSENINLAKLDECYLLANTVMYLSQRQQCQVCQSEQSGNQDIHFVHRISSAEELQKLNDQDKYWFTHPIDDCYMPVSYTHLDVYKRQAQEFVITRRLKQG